MAMVLYFKLGEEKNNLTKNIKSFLKENKLNLSIISLIFFSCLVKFEFYDSFYRNFSYIPLYAIPLFIPSLFKMINSSTKVLTALIHAFFLGATISTVCGFYNFFHIYTKSDKRLMGLLDNPNVYSYAMA